jgi:hypothetical protein
MNLQNLAKQIHKKRDLIFQKIIAKICLLMITCWIKTLNELTIINYYAMT